MKKFLDVWKENLDNVHVYVVNGNDYFGYIQDFDDLGVVMVPFRCASKANQPTLIHWTNIKKIMLCNF